LYFEPRGGTITSGPSSRHHDSHENQQHHDQEEEKEVNMLLRKFKGERLFQIKKRKSTSNTGSKKSAPWLDSQLEDHSKWAVIAADIHMSLDSVLQSILLSLPNDDWFTALVLPESTNTNNMTAGTSYDMLKSKADKYRVHFVSLDDMSHQRKMRVIYMLCNMGRDRYWTWN